MHKYFTILSVIITVKCVFFQKSSTISLIWCAFSNKIPFIFYSFDTIIIALETLWVKKHTRSFYNMELGYRMFFAYVWFLFLARCRGEYFLNFKHHKNLQISSPTKTSFPSDKTTLHMFKMTNRYVPPQIR